VFLDDNGCIYNLTGKLNATMWSYFNELTHVSYGPLVFVQVVSIASFKTGNVRELFDWNPHSGYIFWPSWTREIGSLLQIIPIIAVPFFAIIQSCRYLSNGPPDLFDVRIF